MATIDAILDLLGDLPPLLVYAVLGMGAALENLFPPVPADTFVLLGGFLAARGSATVWVVWVVTWVMNVASALLVYWTGYRYGRVFFEVGLGRYALNEHQLLRMGRFYQRFGRSAIFFTRFLPGLRAVVPAFAGVTHQSFLAVAIPITVASGIWYGALVWIGAKAGENLEAVVDFIDRANILLLLVAVLLTSAVVWWWIRTRTHRP